MARKHLVVLAALSLGTCLVVGDARSQEQQMPEHFADHARQAPDEHSDDCSTVLRNAKERLELQSQLIEKLQARIHELEAEGGVR